MRLAWIGVLCAVFSGVLAADTVTIKRGTSFETFASARVTAWSWRELSFDNYDEDGKKSGSLKATRPEIVSVDRSSEAGTLSEELAEALAVKTSEPVTARDMLIKLAASEQGINKEEATFRLAEVAVLLAEGSRNAAVSREAIERIKAYMTAYKDGFFIEAAYTLLSKRQIALRDLAGARATLKEMTRLGFGRDILANQLLGELEYSTDGQVDAAIAAFREAAKLSGADRVSKHRANAWLGACLVRKQDYNAARPLLEEIINDKDKSFDSDDSFEDEMILSVALPAYGDTLFFGVKSNKDAYDAYIRGAYYQWFAGGRAEGYCLAQAWRCAKRLNVGNDKTWAPRQQKLEEALSNGFPAEYRVARAEEDKK